MAISFNTGTTKTADTATSVAPVIPAGVLAGDVMLMALLVFCEVAVAPALAFSGGGGAWTQIGTTQTCNNGGGVFAYGQVYYRVATAGDPGATLTITETGSSAGTTWLAVAIASYTGANTSSPVDVNGGTAVFGNGVTVTCPPETTGAAGDWAVYLFAGAPAAGATVTGPAGTTQRESINDAAGIGAGIWDSAASAGPAGTPIGGGTFSSSSVNGLWWTAFTVGLAAPATGGGGGFPATLDLAGVSDPVASPNGPPLGSRYIRNT